MVRNVSTNKTIKNLPLNFSCNIVLMDKQAIINSEKCVRAENISLLVKKKNRHQIVLSCEKINLLPLTAPKIYGQFVPPAELLRKAWLFLLTWHCIKLQLMYESYLS